MYRIQSNRTKLYLLLSTIALLILFWTMSAGASSTEFQLIQSLGKREGSPFGKLIKDSAGNLYGTTNYGGIGFGTVFKIDASGNFSILHEFDGDSDGANPYTGLIQANDGNFYGTTYYGGSNGYGTAFKLDTSGNFSVLHEFDGGSPYAELIQASDGNFYGTTYYGGNNGYGTVFKLDLSGNFTILFEFDGSNSGSYPAGLIQASDGSIYGATTGGGSNNAGTVFKLDASGSFSILHSFDEGSYGSPFADLIQTSDGSFYGTTTYGGSNGYGTVFKLDASGNFSVLHEFDGGSGGYYPYAGLVQGSDGNFYGTTWMGGSSDAGTVFKIDSSGNFSILHEFTGGSEGAYLESELILGTDGSFYGTTGGGGSNGTGTVFKLDATGNISVLHEFGLSNVASPTSLVQGSDGNFYGTGSGGLGFGTVFKLESDGNVNILHSFDGSSGGASSPNPGLIQVNDGSLYGTSSGGSYGGGTVFKLDLSGNVSVLHSFDYANGEGYNPAAIPIQGRDGNLYGTTPSGGNNGYGTVYKLDLSGSVSFLHSFDNDKGEGYSPIAAPIQAIDGSLYGTTQYGGSNGGGTVFKLDKSGKFSVLYSFDGVSGGEFIPSGLIQGRDGSFYGTTTENYIDYGTYLYGKVFKIDPSGKFSVLHAFDFESFPNTGMIQASDGNFYGTTRKGGSNNAGTVFKLDPLGNFSVLHSFDDANGSYPEAGLIQASDGSFYGTTYSGGPFWGGAIYRLVVHPDTTTILNSSPNPSLFGQAVIFTATVSGSNPSGTVEFLDGTSSLGSGAISNGVTTLSTSGLSVGTHNITASYSGDANNTANTSAAVSQIVKAATRTALLSSRNPSHFGQAIKLTTVVRGKKPTGTVVFFDGANGLGAAPLNKESKAKLSTSRLKKGLHRLSVRYSGDSKNGASISPVLIQIVR